MRLSQYVLAPLGIMVSVAHTVADDMIVPGAYIVELVGDGDFSSLYSELESNGISVTPRMNLNYGLFNGVSFSIKNASNTEALAARIADKHQVKAIWPVRKIKMPQISPDSIARNNTSGEFLQPTTYRESVFTTDDYSPHVMTQVAKLKAAGYTGKGIRVGVVDTGVDYRHPALGGCFGEGCIIAYGYDFTGDDFYAGSDAPQPDPDPLDTCQGHGTHVAGIIMAQENDLGFTGAAPGVTLGMYKVSGCPGYTTSEILVAAFNKAYEDGSNVISCSAGDDSGWATDAAAVAVSRMSEACVPVVVAVGNSGGLGVWEVASPASGVQVAGIGSVDNTVLPRLLTKASYNNETGDYNFGWEAGTPIAPTNVTLPLWTPGNLTDPANFACNSLPDDVPDLNGTIVLLQVPSACGVDAQAEKLVAKGSKYILYYPESDS